MKLYRENSHRAQGTHVSREQRTLVCLGRGQERRVRRSAYSSDRADRTVIVHEVVLAPTALHQLGARSFQVDDHLRAFGSLDGGRKVAAHREPTNTAAASSPTIPTAPR